MSCLSKSTHTTFFVMRGIARTPILKDTKTRWSGRNHCLRIRHTPVIVLFLLGKGWILLSYHCARRVIFKAILDIYLKVYPGRLIDDDFLETLLHWHHGTTCLLAWPEALHHSSSLHYIISSQRSNLGWPPATLDTIHFTSEIDDLCTRRGHHKILTLLR